MDLKCKSNQEKLTGLIKRTEKCPHTHTPAAANEGVKQGHIEIAVIVVRCAVSGLWQDVMLCLMRQKCRQLVPDMTSSVTNN